MSDSQTLPEFAQDPQTAVENALKIFESGPLKARIDELELNPSYCPHKVCNTSWAGRTIAICCETCQIISPSYLCVPCFLNGNHKGHKYYITYVTTANCSCGNPHKINPSGFCSCHHVPSPNPHLDDFGEELSQIPIQVFSEAIKSLTFLAAFDADGLKIVIDFLLSTATKSDALMRCLEIAFCEKNDLAIFLINSASFSLNSLRILSQFFYSLFNDDYFALNFGYAIMKAIIPFTKLMIYHDIKMAFSSIMPPHHHVFEYMISNYAYLRPQTASFILQKECDIKIIIRSSILQFKRSIDSDWIFSKVKMTFFHQFFLFFGDIIQHLPEDKIEEMYTELLPVFSDWEFTQPFKRVFGNKADDPKKVQELAYELTSCISTILDSLKRSIIHNFHQFSATWLKLNETALKCSKDSKIVEQLSESTLDQASITTIQTFSIIFQNILSDSDDPKALFYDIFNTIKIPIMKFILTTVTIPLRWFSYSSQSYFGFFVRNDDSTLSVAQKFYFKQSITSKLFPLFKMIQFYAGLFKDKNLFLNLIESIYGLFSNFDDENKKNDNLFVIIYFISCLIFDRVIMENDFEEFRKLLLVANLQEKPLTVINLNKLLWDQITTESSYIAELGNITTRVKGEEYSLLKLKPNVKWSIVQPWKPPSEIMKMIGNFIQKNEDKLVPFNDWKEEKHGIDLKSFLLTRSMFALEYRALSDFVANPTMNKATIHIVLNVILQTHRIFKDEEFDFYESEMQNKENLYSEENGAESPDAGHQKDGSDLAAKSMQELSLSVPFHFKKFLNCRIAFLDREEASIVDLMKKVGTLANPVLEELGLSPVVQHEPDRSKDEKRDRAKQLKLSIMANFRNQQNMFDGSKPDVTENDECSVCCVSINDSVLCYPAIVHKTGIPSFVQTGEFSQTYFVNICTHLVHWSCAKNEMNDSMYRCPIDRSMYNFFIPKIASGYSVPAGQSSTDNSNENGSTTTTISNNSDKSCTQSESSSNSNDNGSSSKGNAEAIPNGASKKDDDDDDNDDDEEESADEGAGGRASAGVSSALFYKAMDIINENFSPLSRSINPATVIAGHLAIAEVRYRIWPDSLDKQVFAVFMSNFFLNAWHFVRMRRDATWIGELESHKIKEINEGSRIESLVLGFLEERKVPFVESEVALSIKKFSEGLTGMELFVYLRQAAILQHFCLGLDLSPDTKFTDWESCLSFKSLCDRYGITADTTGILAENLNNNSNSQESSKKNGNESQNNSSNNEDQESSEKSGDEGQSGSENSGESNKIKVVVDIEDGPRSRSDVYDEMSSYTSELPLFCHVKLPYNFLTFALPPYSLNLAETNSLTALCLLTNTVISISKTAGSNSNYIPLGSHLTKLGGTTLLLLLNGPFSTSIAVASNEFSFVVKIISPYVNDYGDEDPGFVTGRMLRLSRERLEKAYDIYLSGEWTKYIPK